MMEILGTVVTVLVVAAVIAVVAWHRYGATVREIWRAITGREVDR